MVEPQALSRESQPDEARTWREVIVPVFGPLWIVLPLCVWLLHFGSGLIALFAGTSAPTIATVAAGLLLFGWAIVAGRLIVRARRSMDPGHSRDSVARTGVVLFIYLLCGAVFFWLITPGIFSRGTPVLRALGGLGVLALAWLGWTGMTPQTRRLALGWLRARRKGA